MQFIELVSSSILSSSGLTSKAGEGQVRVKKVRKVRF